MTYFEIVRFLVGYHYEYIRIGHVQKRIANKFGLSVPPLGFYLITSKASYALCPRGKQNKMAFQTCLARARVCACMCFRVTRPAKRSFR